MGENRKWHEQAIASPDVLLGEKAYASAKPYKDASRTRDYCVAKARHIARLA
jgi:hypothetical protein